jgi:hypothetical protein
LFETYRFDNPKSGQGMVFDRWSWLWAALAGPVYVLARGVPGPALRTLAVSLVVAVVCVAALAFIVGFIDSMLVSLLAIVVLPTAALLVQAQAAIEFMRRDLLRRGWRAGF